MGPPFMAEHCVSKQIGRHDAACQDCPRRVSQPAVLSALLVIQLFGIVIPPPNFSKEHQKERCGHSRSQRSLITFHGALWNILLLAGLSAAVHMITLEQTFVNGPLQKFLLLFLNRIDSISNLYIFTYLYLYFICVNISLSFLNHKTRNNIC